MGQERPRILTLSYKFRLRPTKAQHRALERILEDQRQLYNAALEERVACYQKTGKGRSYYDQCIALSTWRREDTEACGIPANLQRWTLKRLDVAYQSFLRRISRQEKAGYPRFRGAGRWRSFGFAEFSGLRLVDNALLFKGMPGRLRVNLTRPLPGKPLSCVFTRDAKGWGILIHTGVVCAEERAIERSVGIDVGLTHLAVLSDGAVIPNVRPRKRLEATLRRQQRALSRCKLGSRRRRKVKQVFARTHLKVANSRSTYLHQETATIVANFDLIALEELNFRGLSAGHLAKSVADASWGRFGRYLEYKAAKAGAQLVRVNPKNTTQRCSSCGNLVPKDLSVRVHSCESCGLVMGRDLNAARNILQAVAGLGQHNVTLWGERAAGIITMKGTSQ